MFSGGSFTWDAARFVCLAMSRRSGLDPPIQREILFSEAVKSAGTGKRTLPAKMAHLAKVRIRLPDSLPISYY